MFALIPLGTRLLRGVADAFPFSSVSEREPDLATLPGAR
jgi:hypothetical protein